MTKKVKCEVWSRIVGYLRPVDQWNNGKASEFEDRRTFNVPSEIEESSAKLEEAQVCECK